MITYVRAEQGFFGSAFSCIFLGVGYDIIFHDRMCPFACSRVSICLSYGQHQGHVMIHTSEANTRGRREELRRYRLHCNLTLCQVNEPRKKATRAHPFLTRTLWASLRQGWTTTPSNPEQRRRCLRSPQTQTGNPKCSEFLSTCSWGQYSKEEQSRSWPRPGSVHKPSVRRRHR